MSWYLSPQQLLLPVFLPNWRKGKHSWLILVADSLFLNLHTAMSLFSLNTFVLMLKG